MTKAMVVGMICSTLVIHGNGALVGEHDRVHAAFLARAFQIRAADWMIQSMPRFSS